MLLRDGVQWALFLPFELLADLGVLRHGLVSSVRHSLFGRVVAGLVTLIGIVSAVMSLVAGWDEFVAILRGWLGW